MLIRDMIDVLKAFGEGETIQMRDNTKSEWRIRTSATSAFDFASMMYRIKPEPIIQYCTVWDNNLIGGSYRSLERAKECMNKDITNRIVKMEETESYDV